MAQTTGLSNLSKRPNWQCYTRDFTSYNETTPALQPHDPEARYRKSIGSIMTLSRFNLGFVTVVEKFDCQMVLEKLPNNLKLTIGAHNLDHVHMKITRTEVNLLASQDSSPDCICSCSI